MRMSVFLRERGQAYADNAVATLLLVGGSVAVGWLINHFAPLWGLDPSVAFILAWVVALLVAVALSLLLKPKTYTPEAERLGARVAEGGIVNAPHFEFNPRIEVNPSFNQSQTQRQSQTQQQPPISPPSITPIEARVREVYVTPLGEATDETESFDVSNTKLPVALIDFYRGADNSPEPFVDVRGHISFFNPAGERVYRINDAHWWKARRHHKTFEPGDSRRMVVAIISNGRVIPYEGRFKAIEATYETDEKYFELTSEPLEGDRLRVRVELIGTRGSVQTFNDSTGYDLTTNPPALTLRNIEGDES
jgi:hypothetical protein